EVPEVVVPGPEDVRAGAGGPAREELLLPGALLGEAPVEALEPLRDQLLGGGAAAALPEQLGRLLRGPAPRRRPPAPRRPAPPPPRAPRRRLGPRRPPGRPGPRRWRGAGAGLLLATGPRGRRPAGGGRAGSARAWRWGRRRSSPAGSERAGGRSGGQGAGSGGAGGGGLRAGPRSST